jgi:hypothetical protein
MEPRSAAVLVRRTYGSTGFHPDCPRQPSEVSGTESFTASLPGLAKRGALSKIHRHANEGAASSGTVRPN